MKVKINEICKIAKKEITRINSNTPLLVHISVSCCIYFAYMQRYREGGMGLTKRLNIRHKIKDYKTIPTEININLKNKIQTTRNISIATTLLKI
jgi:hypothetical protein